MLIRNINQMKNYKPIMSIVKQLHGIQTPANTSQYRIDNRYSPAYTYIV
jgi:hypothetical protein